MLTKEDGSGGGRREGRGGGGGGGGNKEREEKTRKKQQKRKRRIKRIKKQNETEEDGRRGAGARRRKRKTLSAFVHNHHLFCRVAVILFPISVHFGIAFFLRPLAIIWVVLLFVQSVCSKEVSGCSSGIKDTLKV